LGSKRGLISYASRATPKRQQIWQDLGLTPRSVDREIVEIMHRTHMGVDQDAENILNQAMRTALGDGWGGSMLATDISDILFGTPSPLQSAVNLGVLKDDEVNIVLHGHDPALSEMIVAASTGPRAAGLCRVQGRQGDQPGGHLLHRQRGAHAPRHSPAGQFPLARSWRLLRAPSRP
jgi:carbon-monoxide dehydrogenase catalytic subunit